MPSRHAAKLASTSERLRAAALPTRSVSIADPPVVCPHAAVDIERTSATSAPRVTAIVTTLSPMEG